MLDIKRSVCGIVFHAVTVVRSKKREENMKPSFLSTCSIIALLYNECSFAMNADRQQLSRQESHIQLHAPFTSQEGQNRDQEAGSAQLEEKNKLNTLDESSLNLSKISNEMLCQYQSFHYIKNLEMNAEYLYGKTESLLRLSALPLSQLQSLKLVGDVGENKAIQRNLDDLLSRTLQLKELALSGNKLKTLPKAIRKLQKLEILDISRNPQLRNLPQSLWKSPNLQKVTINSDLISLNQVPEYIEILKSEELLTLLSSYKNKHKLSNSQIEDIKNNLHFCKTISVHGCHWNDETHSWIKTSSKSSSKIVKLKNTTLAKALIYYISGKEHWDAVAKLMTHGINIGTKEANSLDKYGIPILIKAAESGHLNVVQYLVKHGADINVRTKFENTALMGASLFGYLDIVKYLVAQGADVNDQNVGGETALMRAAVQRHLGIVKYLFHNGANINAQDRFGGTTLMKGAFYGSLNIVKYLIKHGANINAKDDNGYTALMRAVLEGQLNIVKYLIQNGANIDDRNKYGETALIKAIGEEQLNVAKCLIELGANINITDNNGKTAMHFALKRLKKASDANIPKYQELVELLEQKTAPISKTLQCTE